MKKYYRAICFAVIVMLVFGCFITGCESTNACDMVIPEVVISESTGLAQTGATVPSTVHVHNFCVTDEVAPGCESTGYCVYACSCGDQYIADETAAINHSWSEWSEVEDAAEEGNDVYERVCLLCGQKEQRAWWPEVNGHMHGYTISRVSPTCTEQGYTLYSCECGNSYKEDYTHALGHAYVKEVIEPGCETEGFTAYVCSACEDTYREDFVPALGHDYTSTVVEPSCTEDGYVLYVCAVCGEEYREAWIEELGHDYQYESSKPSTTTVAGYKLYRCANCGNTKQERLPLKASAVDTDMCGESLIGQALPNAPYPEFSALAMERWNHKMGRQESCAADLILFPENIEDRRATVDVWKNTYSYVTRSFRYVTNCCDDGTSTFNCWASEEAYAQQDAAYAEVQKILAELGIDNTVTQKEAIIRINKWLCDNRYYDYGEDRLRERTLYYSMFSEKGVCHHYAMAFQALCLGAGIECHYYASTTMNHAWNKVYFSDGTYLWVDVCWNDSYGTSNYLLIDTAQLLKDHKL